MSIDTKGGKEAFAAGASQSSRNGMTGHSNDHQTMAFFAPPQVGLKPTLTNAAQRTNVRKSGDGQNVPKPKRVLPRVFCPAALTVFNRPVHLVAAAVNSNLDSLVKGCAVSTTNRYPLIVCHRDLWPIRPLFDPHDMR